MKKFTKYSRFTIRILLLLVAAFWFVFALLSGAESYGGGLRGILMNSPNALPWLLLFALVYIVWKWELIGGILITLAGLATIFAFDTYEHIWTFLTISLPLLIIGGISIINWKFTKKTRPTS